VIRGSLDDGYAATAGAYDQLSGPFRAALDAAIEPFLEACRPDLGRLAAHPEWYGRGTVRPEPLFGAAAPVRIQRTAFGDVEVGDLRNRGRLEARPDGGDWLIWRMTYQTIDGDRVVHEAVTEHRYSHPAPAALRAEALAAGLATDRADGTGYWNFRR
jgi:hypothetical protein